MANNYNTASDLDPDSQSTQSSSRIADDVGHSSMPQFFWSQNEDLYVVETWDATSGLFKVRLIELQDIPPEATISSMIFVTPSFSQLSISLKSYAQEGTLPVPRSALFAAVPPQVSSQDSPPSLTHVNSPASVLIDPFLSFLASFDLDILDDPADETTDAEEDFEDAKGTEPGQPTSQQVTEAFEKHDRRYRIRHPEGLIPMAKFNPAWTVAPRGYEGSQYTMRERMNMHQFPILFDSSERTYQEYRCYICGMHHQSMFVCHALTILVGANSRSGRMKAGMRALSMHLYSAHPTTYLNGKPEGMTEDAWKRQQATEGMDVHYQVDWYFLRSIVPTAGRMEVPDVN